MFFSIVRTAVIGALGMLVGLASGIFGGVLYVIMTDNSITDTSYVLNYAMFFGVLVAIGDAVGQIRTDIKSMIAKQAAASKTKQE